MKHGNVFSYRDSLMSFWEKIESKIAFKLLFVLLVGLYGASIGLLMALLLLYGYDSKWIFILIGFGFSLGIVLSPLEYRHFKKKYRKYIDNEKFIQKKDTSKFIEKLKK